MPERLTRADVGHVAHLARLEGRTAFNELYRRWPDLQVDLDGVQYVHMANVAGPSSVPVAV